MKLIDFESQSLRPFPVQLITMEFVLKLLFYKIYFHADLPLVNSFIKVFHLHHARTLLPLFTSRPAVLLKLLLMHSFVEESVAQLFFSPLCCHK